MSSETVKLVVTFEVSLDELRERHITPLYRKPYNELPLPSMPLIVVNLTDADYNAPARSSDLELLKSLIAQACERYCGELVAKAMDKQ